MASVTLITTTATTSSSAAFLGNNANSTRFNFTRRLFSPHFSRRRSTAANFAIEAKLGETQKTSLQFNKLGDSDLLISEITLGTMTFGEQNMEKEAHDMLSYAFDQGINILDTAEAYPIPMKKETQGRTDLYIGSWLKSQPRDKVIIATKVCGYSERSGYIRDNAEVLRVDAANIKESVEKSLKRLNTDYIDLLQIHWPDRYAPLFGEFLYDYNKWREGVPFEEQLKALQEVIDEGKVRYIGVSNESSYGVMEFVHAAKVGGLPKIVSIQNCYNLLTRFDLVEVCHPNNCNIGLLAYSPLGGGNLSGKYLDPDYVAAKKGRLNLFPGYMERYISSYAKVVTAKYVELASKHGLSPVQLALAFVRDRPFVTSSIIGATSVDQLKEDIDAFLTVERPLSQEVMQDIEYIFKRNKDPAID
uniref:NADP-dependent oxidoreductase domain-containing protein n=1 Tax=Chenopodium quinoa TaxID=63459 RepID=A0A803KSY2_CHEQI